MSSVLWSCEELRVIFDKTDIAAFQATGVSIDTRTLKPGDLYIALKGENLDGHAYVKKAFEAGASAALVCEDFKGEAAGPLIKVPCTMDALYGLAKASRLRSKATIIAITGSAGKTTTKDMLAHVLERVGATHKALASFNNHIGVPLTLASMPLSTVYGIFELGMNHTGEIEPLAKLVSPHYACITTIAEAHMGLVGSITAIAQEKASIFKGLVGPSKAVLNLDAPCIEVLLLQSATYSKKVLTYGCEKGDLKLLKSLDDHLAYELGAKKYDFSWNFKGEHNRLNALGVLSICHGLGLDIKKANERLSTLFPTPGRGQIVEVFLKDKTITLMDESYNANPSSMKAALKNLIDFKATGRKIALLGDMLELEAFSQPYHEELADIVSWAAIDQIFTVGMDMKAYFFPKLEKSKKGAAFESVERVFDILKDSLKENDVLLIKGSKGSFVYKVAAEFLSYQKRG